MKLIIKENTEIEQELKRKIMSGDEYPNAEREKSNQKEYGKHRYPLQNHEQQGVELIESRKE